MSTSAIAAALGAYILFIIVLLILLVVAYWKMFTKAGIAGWKSLIPLYNVYIAFKIAWKDQTAFWVWLAANVVYGLFRDHEDGVSGVITIAAGILALVWWMRFCIRQAKSYGKGAGTGIAAFFLPNILTLYYGLPPPAPMQVPRTSPGALLWKMRRTWQRSSNAMSALPKA